MQFDLADVAIEVVPNTIPEEVWEADEVVRAIHTKTGVMVECCRFVSRHLNRTAALAELKHVVDEYPIQSCSHLQYKVTDVDPKLLVCTSCRTPLHRTSLE